jgi:hypothetical protein
MDMEMDPHVDYVEWIWTMLMAIGSIALTLKTVYEMTGFVGV